MTNSDATAPSLCMTFGDGVPATARCLDGHFPGNPIVPGAMLLGYAAKGLRKHGFDLASVTRMKFQRPLLPDTAFEINVNGSAIVWCAGDAVIAQARVSLRACGG